MARRILRATRLASVGCTALLLCGCGGSSPSSPSGSGWLVESIASGEKVGVHSALTSTSDGRIHLAYYDLWEQSLRVAVRSTSGEWSYTRLDSIGWLGRFPAITCTDGDTLHMAFQDTWSEDLMYALGVDGSWQIERLDASPAVGYVPVFAADGADLLLMDLDDGRDRFTLRRRAATGTWTTDGSFGVSRATNSLSLTAGPEGPISAVFTPDGSRGTPQDQGSLEKFSRGSSPTSWSRQTITTGRISFDSVAIEYDAAESLHLLYTEHSGRLQDAGHSTVDTGVFYGLVRLRKGPDGSLWALYPVHHGLALSHLPNGAGGWERVATLGSLNPSGRWDLHVDDSSVIHVSAYSASGRRLWYARWEDGP